MWHWSLAHSQGPGIVPKQVAFLIDKAEHGGLKLLVYEVIKVDTVQEGLLGWDGVRSLKGGNQRNS